MDGRQIINNKQKICHVVKVGLDKIKMSRGRVQFLFYIAPMLFVYGYMTVEYMFGYKICVY